MMLHPVNAAAPLAVVTGLAEHASVAPLPGWVLMERVTEALDVVTVLPPLSSMATTGCVLQVAALGPPPGWVVKPSCVAGPTVMVRLFEVALGEAGGRGREGVGARLTDDVAPGERCDAAGRRKRVGRARQRRPRPRLGVDGQGD